MSPGSKGRSDMGAKKLAVQTRTTAFTITHLHSKGTWGDVVLAHQELAPARERSKLQGRYSG